MLQDKGCTDGSLYKRIQQAAKEHLITAEMQAWADEVRLDANSQRHANKKMELPTQEDAERSIEFARALAEYLYVLPARVQQGKKKRGEEG